MLRIFQSQYYLQTQNLSSKKLFLIYRRLQSLKDENLDNLELVRTEHYEEEHKIMKPISMSIIQLGKYDKAPLVVREDSISILKRNSKFTSYSKYINKNVVDIQLSYEKNPLK